MLYCIFVSFRDENKKKIKKKKYKNNTGAIQW